MMTIKDSTITIIVIQLFTLITLSNAGTSFIDSLFDGRIVGGASTTINQFPHQVSLRYQNRHRCGGSIISENHILTAAHCVTGIVANRMIIRAGTTYKDSRGTDTKVSRTIIHEGYNSNGQDNDIAIIILASSLQYSERIRAINLDDNNDSNNLKKTGTVAYVSGWGTLKEGGTSSSALNYASVLIVSQESCSKSYYPIRITNGMLCAGLANGGRDSCQGDSGGPLIVNNKNTPTQIGVVSWGNGCGRPGYPGVYAKVSAYRSWINRHVNVKTEEEIKITNKI